MHGDLPLEKRYMAKGKIALALGGGGARGVAHIGAIEELETQGYEIVSVAGTSMGALVGGMYAAGALASFREWICALDRYKVLGLVDFVFSADGLVKGDRVINALKELVPDVAIESLPLPFAAVAADLLTGCEVVFERGGLYDAVRASISIPSVFQPWRLDGMILIDGGTVNPVPVDRVRRAAGDRLVAVDVSAPFAARERGPVNYYRLLASSSEIMQQRIARLMYRFHPPDLLVEIPADSYSVFEFYRAAEIVEAGRLAMREALAARAVAAAV